VSDTGDFTALEVHLNIVFHKQRYGDPLESDQGKGLVTSTYLERLHLICYDIGSSAVWISCTNHWKLLDAVSSLSVQRLRTLQEKKEAQAKSARRDIATLLERSKLETARVKVENSVSQKSRQLIR
jgi:hypothetical protein